MAIFIAVESKGNYKISAKNNRLFFIKNSKIKT